jgi:hypothetical protein
MEVLKSKKSERKSIERKSNLDKFSWPFMKEWKKLILNKIDKNRMSKLRNETTFVYILEE